MKDIIGKRFGHLVAIERAGKINSVQIIRCKCDCGNTTLVRYPNLTSGTTTSCGCVKRARTSACKLKDLTGLTFGELTVVARFSDVGVDKIKWLCTCTCGSMCIAQGSNLKTGNTTSCGCMRASVNESIIIKELRKQHVVFEKEAKFSDLKSSTGRPLRFDFKIYLKNGSFFLLEYQGEQHFNRLAWSSNGYAQREFTDEMKRRYCKKKKIELVTITYKEETLPKLISILEDHDVLYANTVPRSGFTDKV